jgi:S1-C subfamily serine protease
MKKWIVLLVAGLALGLVSCSLGANPTPEQAVPSTPLADLTINIAQHAAEPLPTAVPQEVINAADAEHLLLNNIYERVAPSVVNIEVTTTADALTFSEQVRGSGFVYDKEGYIITNAHVVLDARQVYVTFEDGSVAEAKIIGHDTYSDLAVIRVDVDEDRLVPVVVGDSEALHVGDRAIAIGNPFGLATSMTVGIVSGLGRQLRSAELIDNTIAPGFQNPSIIQVDTDINPGNSGGPLLNSHGEVIGVTTAIRTESGVFEGVGFAVPSSTLKRVIPELIESGEVKYPWLGISARSSEDGFGVSGLVEILDLPVNSGVLISGVIPDSPADKAGLKGGSRPVNVRGEGVCAGGDIIVAIDGVFVNNLDELVAYLVVNKRPDDTITLLVVRGDETFEVSVVLEPRPADGGGTTPACGQ